MISLKKISAQVQGEALFDGVSVTIGTGDRVGIVGPNGSGKSTLLRIVAGLLEPDSGTVNVERERLGYLPQDVEFAQGETIESVLAHIPPAMQTKVLKEVGLQSLDAHAEVLGLSGGQKRRLALAQVLGNSPTFLLLDEPTNHLDQETVEWLERFVQEFRGGVVVVSHDRSLLDHTVKKIFEIDPRTHALKEYTGNYTMYVAERAKRDRLQNEAHDRQQKEKRRLETWLARKREESRIFADPRKGKQIRAKERYLEREILEKPIAKAGVQKKIRGAALVGEAAGAKLMYRLTGVAKSFEGKVVLKNISFEARGSERVLLVGKNGSGKTTILKLLAGLLVPDSGELKVGESVSVGYFAQEQELLDVGKSVLDEFLDTPNLLPGKEPRAVLGAFLFSDHDVFKKVGSLSLGERVRLVFAKLTNQKNELLVLDEPTNHLDIPSREVIEQALLAYEGAIIAVSHDRFFVETVGFDRVLEVSGGVLLEKK